MRFSSRSITVADHCLRTPHLSRHYCKAHDTNIRLVNRVKIMTKWLIGKAYLGILKAFTGDGTRSWLID